MISMIVAHDKNYVIGYENAMPWHLPGDLQYFKQVTMGKPVIMGRKTFESIGRPLPGRRNIIVSRNTAYSAQGIEVVPSVEAALALVDGAEEIMIIGGEQIFTQCLPMADRLYITHINNEFIGDTYFPKYEGWQLVSSQDVLTAPEGFTYQYCIFEK